jgi:hypothetical protein
LVFDDVQSSKKKLLHEGGFVVIVPLVLGYFSRAAVNAAPSLPFNDTPPPRGRLAASAAVAALAS